MKQTHQEVIGVVPAGGKASRVAPLPCSKELYPVGFHPIGKGSTVRPKVVSQFVLENMRRANIKKAYIILREGKWDIPAYFGDGEPLNMHLAYLMMGLPFGVPYTLDQAYPFVENALVALGFPDMIVEPDDAFVTLLARREELNADIVLGLFPAVQPQKTDMVEFDETGRVRAIRIKPAQTQLLYAWEIAIWTPVFTCFMHDFVSSGRERSGTNCGTSFDERNEVHVADVIQAAIDGGMNVEAVLFENGSCLDIGTPEDMLKAVRLQVNQRLA
jgi:glucose-1-phosphate thymidylyltransferase